MKCNSLEEVRENIDRLDDNIIQLIAERGEYVIQASSFKKNADGVKSPDRVEKVIESNRIWSRSGYVRKNIQGYDSWIYKNGIRGI